jgi:NADH:ubiquinone reductase (H+-translocating)
MCLEAMSLLNDCGNMQRVLIVGGGFGGVRVACALAKHTSRKDVEIVLIDEREAHVYTPWLYEIATAITPVRSEVAVRRARLRATVPFSWLSGVRIIHARVMSVAADGSHVVCADGTSLRADVIVLAVGSLTNDFGIPGVTTFAEQLKTPEEADHIARNLQRLFHDVAEERIPHATVVVGGAGANGVELVAEIAAVRNAYMQQAERDPSQVRLVLCDTSDEPVKMFPPVVRKDVAKRLHALGVEFFGKTAIREVRAGEIRAENITLPYDMLIWSAGVKSRREPGEVWGLPVNERGRIRVASTFLVEGKKNIFALGDAAAREGVSPDPQSAQAASVQGFTVAKNVLALLRGDHLQSFKHSSWQTLLAVGGSYGVGRIFGLPIQGRIAFWVRRGVDIKYFFSFLSVRQLMRLWYRGGERYGEHDASRS